MHILIIPSWYPTSPHDITGSFFREQALALEKQGCKVGVISLQLRSLRNWLSVFTGKYNLNMEVDQGVLTYRKHGMIWFPRIPKLQAWLWGKKAMQVFEQYINQNGKPDIIHVHSMLYGGWAAKVISDRFQIPYVVTEHSSSFARGLVTKAQKNLAQPIAESAKKKFAVSGALAKLLTEAFVANNIAWEVMPNIAHSRFFNQHVEKRGALKPFVFINIALLTPIKGGRILINAFAKALGSQPNLELKIGGDGSELAALMSLTNELGIADKVEFLGMLSREQVADQISSVDAFVLSSMYETFGIVVIEALALGKPVIATRCGGPEDIVREEDGILIPTNDEAALAEAMLSLYNNRQKYKSDEIRISCRARYSEPVIAKKLMRAYDEILEKNLQPRVSDT